MLAHDFRNRLAGEVPGLLGYARRIVRDAQLAEDLVQETLLRALQRADSFRGEASLATWLHRILHNAVDTFRANREDATEDIERDVEEKWHDDSSTVDAAVVVERAETRQELEDALVRLPVIYRIAVVLHDAEGLTVREIAETSTTSFPTPTGRSSSATSRPAPPARRFMPASSGSARPWAPCATPTPSCRRRSPPASPACSRRHPAKPHLTTRWKARHDDHHVRHRLVHRLQARQAVPG